MEGSMHRVPAYGQEHRDLVQDRRIQEANPRKPQPIATNIVISSKLARISASSWSACITGPGSTPLSATCLQRSSSRTEAPRNEVASQPRRSRAQPKNSERRLPLNLVSHVLGSPQFPSLSTPVRSTGHGGVDRWVRGEENASDHAPAWIVLDR